MEDLEERRCRVFYAADLKMRGKVRGEERTTSGARRV